MKYKQYSPEDWNRIEKAVEKALATDPAPVAAFDADGTLWDTDLGEAYFNYKIDNRLVKFPEDPWNYYVELKKNPAGPGEAYLWLAQVLSGQMLEQARAWADDAVIANHPTPIFPEQKRLIEFLLSKGVHVMIVTASVKWAVEPGARLLGLTNENVIGIETFVENGRLTDKLKGTITHRQGKADAILKFTGGKRPFLAAGNTMSDFELIESATDIHIAVSAASRDDRLFKTEDELQKIARAKNWIAYRAISGE